MTPTSVVLRLLTLALGGLLAVAGALKLGDPSAFAQEIVNYRFMAELAPYIAAILPATELVLGIALCVGPAAWRRAAALAALPLLVAFTVAVSQALFRGINISCGCFGSAAASPISWLTLARNLLLIATATVILVAPPATPTTSTPRSPSATT